MTPSASVIDDVPILATTRTVRPPRWYSKLKLGDPDDVAVAGAGPGEQLGHAERFSWMVDVRQRLGRGDVVERDDALDLAADEAELVLAEPLDPGAVGVRAG